MSSSELPLYLDKVLYRFENISESSDGWVASCPCATHGHDGIDNTPSVRITTGGDGAVLLCCRVGCTNDELLEATGLSWRDLYPSDGEEPYVFSRRNSSESSELSSEEISLRDEVYNVLLDYLSLSYDHSENLSSRGFSYEETQSRKYRSLPDTHEALENLLSSHLIRLYEEDLFTVPGFSKSYPHVPSFLLGGLLIPVRNDVGYVIALKVRREEFPKYVYFSSPENSCGCPVHVPVCNPRSDTVVVTEGELKADLVSSRGYSCISVPGVSNWRTALPVLTQTLARSIIVAYDWPDVCNKPAVLKSLRMFVDVLRLQGYSVSLWVWDGNPECKGIDDLFASGHEPDLVKPREVDSLLSGLFANLGISRCEVPVTKVQELPAFPTHVFPEAIRTFVEQTSATKQCPEDFAGLGCLVVAAAAIGGARSLRVHGDWVEHPSFYSVIVADPGSRKTPVLKTVMKPVYEAQALEARLYERRKEDFKYLESEYKRAIKSLSRRGVPLSVGATIEPPVLEPLRTLYVNDTTIEALATILRDCPRGVLVFRDELTAWVRGMDQYKGGKGTDRQFFLSGWSGEAVKVDRKGNADTIFIERPYLSVLGSTQPDMLKELEDKQGREDGFLHRILFSFPASAEAQHWTAPFQDSAIPADLSRHEVWSVSVRRLLALQLRDETPECARGVVLGMTEAAYDRWVLWYNSHVDEKNDPDFDKALLGPWCKMEAYAARFALVLRMLRAVQDGGSEGDVDACDVEGAVLLVDYFKSHARKVYAAIKTSGDDREVASLVTWLMTQPSRSAAVKDIASRFKLTKSATTKLLQKAADRGVGRVVKVDKVDYFLHEPE